MALISWHILGSLLGSDLYDLFDHELIVDEADVA